MKKRILILVICLALTVCGAVFLLPREKTQGAPAGCVQLRIDCAAVASDADPALQLPADGILFFSDSTPFFAGESVFDLVRRTCMDNRIAFEFTGTTGKYIEGIANLYEMDYGPLSGWMFFVNGENRQIACDGYPLQDGDCVEWYYTCDMGADLERGVDAEE